eukprot:1182255-Prorocentrum_minimum.AAC.2
MGWCKGGVRVAQGWRKGGARVAQGGVRREVCPSHSSWGPRGGAANSVDVKGKRVDVKGKRVDVKGKSVDVKGNSADVKGNSVFAANMCRRDTSAPVAWKRSRFQRVCHLLKALSGAVVEAQHHVVRVDGFAIARVVKERAAIAHHRASMVTLRVCVCGRIYGASTKVRDSGAVNEACAVGNMLCTCLWGLVNISEGWGIVIEEQRR